MSQGRSYLQRELRFVYTTLDIQTKNPVNTRMLIVLIFLVIAYLLGSISSAIVICKLMGLPDPRTEGSKNPGATNVLRIAGSKVALLVLLGDALKGFLAVMIARLLGVGPMSLAVVAYAAVIGHMFPCFFDFKGGKGVATALGSLFGLSLLLGVMGVVIWLAALGLTRISSLSAIVTFCLTPFISLVVNGPIFFLPLVLMSATILWMHWDNIERLIEGTEPKLQTNFRPKSEVEESSDES